jgi:DNA invertase Pin-like site-specific DNA recombinase
MHLNPDQTALLKRVVKARERREKAESDGRDAALRAVAAGVPQSRVADAFGVTRMTMWRWLLEQADSEQSPTPARRVAA